MEPMRTLNVQPWKNYVEEVREHVPNDYEIALHQSGVSYTSSAYIFNCFMTDVSAEECAKNMLDKFRSE